MHRILVRSLAFTCVLTLAIVSGIPAICAQEAPNYWAGNVSLSYDSSAAAQAFSEPRSSEENPASRLDNRPAADQGPAFERPKESAEDAHTVETTRAPQQSQLKPVSPPADLQTRPANLIAAAYRQTAMLSQLNPPPIRTPIQPNTPQPLFRSSLRHAKPFEGVANGPTVTPYLNLFRDEDTTSEGAPDFYTFVQPQLEQQDAQRRQQIQLQQVQRQMRRTAPSTGGIQYGGAVAAGVSSPARFMDTAQFYNGWQH
jgi:hypothetical protein